MRQRHAWATAVAIVLVAAVILLLCLAGFEDFFFTDDAQNAALPFLYEMGRLWLSADLPILTTRAWLGGNMLVDMALSPFAPQMIVASLLAATSPTRAIPVLAYAGINLVLIVFSGWWLGRAYGLGRRWSLLLGFLLATQPMFLYMFAASWWNGASAYAWFLFAFAALMHWRRGLGPGSFTCVVVGACALCASALTQIQLSFAVLCVLVGFADYREHRSLRRIALLSLAPASAFLIAAIPLMAEYVMSSGWLTRTNGWHNTTPELVTNWGLVLNTFNPLYGGYTAWFFGHQHYAPSFGYSTALLFFAIAFFRWKSPDTPEQRVLFGFALAALLLCFLPSQTGPMRHPLRFLAALAVPLSIYALQRLAFGIQRVDSRTLHRAAMFIVVVTALTYFSAQGSIFDPDAMMRLLMTPALFGGAALALVRVLRQQKKRDAHVFWAMSVSLLAWMLSLLITPSIAGSAWPYAVLPDRGGIRPTGRPGYVLGLCDRGSAWGRPEQVGELTSARFLLYDQPAINGYSSIGHKGLRRHFPHDSPHGTFRPGPTLLDMARPAPGLPGIHVHQLFDISDIFACDRDLNAPLLRKLAAAGLQQAETGLKDGRVRLRATNQLASIGSLLQLPDAGGIRAAGSAEDRHEAFEVPGRTEARRLYFSRLYWPGYSATLDGQPLRVGPYLDTVVEVEVPPGASGRLDLHYEPVSWRWTRWSLVLGLLLAGGTMAVLASGRRRPPQS